MIPLAYLFVAGVIHFADQPLPGLEVGSRMFPAAMAPVNTHPADIDEDGLTDLILPSGVWLQRGGVYPKSVSVPLPDRNRFEIIHAEKGRLYGYGADRLSCYSLFAGKWREEWSVSITTLRTPDVNLQSLFHDIDGDGHVELIVPGDGKLIVFRVSANAQPIAELPVFTPIRPQIESVNNLWASLAKPPPGAGAARSFRAEFDAATVTTQETLHAGEHRIEYRFATYTLQRNSEGLFSCPPPESWASAALPEAMIAYRSGRDRAIAFAGARLVQSGAMRFGEPLSEVYLASKNNAALQTIRTKSPPAYLALADFDGDGDEDLLTQSNTLGSGPPREVLTRLMSAHSLRHNFFVHVRGTDGRFDSRPREMLGIDIDLGTPAFEEGPRWQAYRQGALTCASADFNGDGRADIAASINAGHIAVWLNQEGVFQQKPDAVLSVANAMDISAADVDRDGHADLIVLPPSNTGAAPVVWFSR